MEVKNRERLYMITLDLTYKCNFRCLHCFNNSGEHNLGLEELTDDEIRIIVEDIIKLRPQGVCICGGEALLRKDLACEIARKIVEGTGGKTQVNMVTNGYLMTQEIADDLKKAGFTNVQISLDGLEENYEWLRNKKGAFKHAVDGLKYLVKAGLKADVSFCPTKKNCNEAVDVMKLCDDIGVYSFRTQPLMLLGRAKDNLKDYVLSNEEYRKLVLELETCNYDECKTDMEYEWGDPTEHLREKGRKAAANYSTIEITGYGKLVSSPYIPLEIGDLKKHSLIEYWNNDFNKIPEKKLISSLYDLVLNSENMDVKDVDKKCPRNYYERSIYVDWIDDREKFDCSYDEIIL